VSGALPLLIAPVDDLVCSFPELTNAWACSHFQGVPRLVVNASERAKAGLDINKAVELWAWTYEKGAVSCQGSRWFSTEVVD
jgi:hypothetical protein